MIAYTHTTNRRSRSIRIKVEPNGEVVVVTPPYCPPHAIENFVAQNLAWIENTRAKIKARQAVKQNPTKISVFGQEYDKVIEYQPSKPSGIHVVGTQLQINPLNPTLSDTELVTQIDRFLKATAEKYIVPRTHQLGKLMRTSFKHITLKEQRTRWGSCSSEGNLNFNWRLVHYPPAIIDYVIIHELAHRTHMNHSAAFWNLVRQYDPEYLKHRGWLKRHGMSVG